MTDHSSTTHLISCANKNSENERNEIQTFEYMYVSVTWLCDLIACNQR
jgi:hypothetical protein